MKRKIALAMVLAMTATMAHPVLAADDKTTLDVIISQYGTRPRRGGPSSKRISKLKTQILI